MPPGPARAPLPSRSTGPSRTAARRLVLAGGGHAHVEVLRRLAARRPPGLDVTLVSPAPSHPYTGMITGYVAGEYALEEVLFRLAELARAAGARFVASRVERVLPEERAALLEGGRRLEYDLLSLDVGSGVQGAELLPAGDPRVFAARPLARLVELARALDEAPEGARVVVVGGGPAGVELALTAGARLARRRARARMLLLEARGRLLPEALAGVGGLAARVLGARGIEVRTGAAVVAVREGSVRDSAGREHPFDLLVWATGPAAPDLARRSGLAVDPEGWLRVDGALRALGREDVFGAGDCAALEGSAWVAKAGVYAVRQGPVLWCVLRSALEGGPPPDYRPQRRYLWILNTGDGRGLLVREPVRAHARWARVLKDRIDRRFLRRYRSPGTP